MTERRRSPRSPGQANPGAEPDNTGDNSASLAGFAEATREHVTRGQRWLAKYQSVPGMDVVLGIFRRDRQAAGPVMSSALAFRLFLFFLPMLLLTIGVAGFASEVVDARSVDRAAGLSGGLAKQVSTAFHQSGLTRWVAVLLGLWGVLVAGRSLSRVLYAASAAAWGLPLGGRARLRAVGAVAGLVCTIGVIAIVIGRIKESFGIGSASASYLPALLIYTIAWLGVLMFLPRATEDPGALLPGCLLVALTLTVMHAVSELFLPDRLDHASRLYGTFGITVVTLGWFFILGRAIIVAMELNAAIYDRYGRISQAAFSLPALRILARRSSWVRRFFDLTEASDQSSSND
jgi:uncharacterized BrkB/YihY/UPF0761 family membrane protein